MLWLPLPWLTGPRPDVSSTGEGSGGSSALLLDAISYIAHAGFGWVLLLVLGITTVLALLVFLLSGYWSVYWPVLPSRVIWRFSTAPVPPCLLHVPSPARFLSCSQKVGLCLFPAGLLAHSFHPPV